MRIGIDLDGVLVDFDAGLREMLFRTSRKVIPPGEPPCWEWPATFGITDTQERDAWDLINASPDFWETLPEYSAFTHELKEQLIEVALANDVYFITDRRKRGAKQQTERWLASRGLVPSVAITNQKGLVAKALYLDVFIDDRPENCLDVRAYRPDARIYLQRRPWNAAFHPRQGHLTEVTSLRELFVAEALV